jgi:RNase H-like domain found in reverse transcriptase
VIAPLTDITRENAKWTWDSKHKEAFPWIQSTIAQQVLLKYPDFLKPFDIFTDASDHQRDAVIAQEGWPVAFY